VAVNPVTNKIYVANQNSNNVTVITEQQVQAIPLTTVHHPAPANQTTILIPSFTFTAQSTFSPNAAPAAHVYFQMDTCRALGQTLPAQAHRHWHGSRLAAGLPHYLRICGRPARRRTQSSGARP